MEIHITEFDVALGADDPASFAAQGDVYAKVAQICLQTSTCRVFRTWGLTDKYSWIPSYSKGKQGWALPFDADCRKKPVYQSMLKALHSQ